MRRVTLVGALVLIAAGIARFEISSKEARSKQVGNMAAQIAADPSGSMQPLYGLTIGTYCPCVDCCGRWADTTTALNDDATECDGVSAKFSLLPRRSTVYIEGVGEREVDDRLPEDSHYDVLIRYPNHAAAIAGASRLVGVTTVYIQ